MIDPTEADIGRRVLYRNFEKDIGEGVVTSFNNRCVFVLYSNANAPKQTDPCRLEMDTHAPKPTDRCRLEWVAAKEDAEP
jgi:hypothetical protein